MTKERYLNEYLYMTRESYSKLTKKELLNVMADFTDGLRNGIQEYMTPSGDEWNVKDEVCKWYRLHFKKKCGYICFIDRDENGEPIGEGIMWRKKDWFVDYVIVLDLAYANMNNVIHKHRYYDCYTEMRKAIFGH